MASFVSLSYLSSRSLFAFTVYFARFPAFDNCVCIAVSVAPSRFHVSFVSVTRACSPCVSVLGSGVERGEEGLGGVGQDGDG